MKKTDPTKTEKLKKELKSILIIIFIAMIIRTFLFEPFRIPSSSMAPNLLVGDFIVVSKYSYGYSNKGTFLNQQIIPTSKKRYFSNNKPQAGDVIVFRLPDEPKTYYIKRVVGLPGDKIQIKDEQVYINDYALSKREIGDYLYEEDGTHFTKYIEKNLNGAKYDVIEEMPNETYDNTQQWTIPANHYFVMGDNRDRSADSRTSKIHYPFVPLDNIVGRAERVLFSMDYNFEKWGFKKPFGLRFERFYKKIK